MRIGLIDVDGRHGKKKWGATIYPNVALGKIARWHTMQGDEVEWAQPIDLFDRHHYDILYASKVFNFSPDIDFSQFSYDRLEKGGTGYDIYKRLPDEIDKLQPLYTMYPWLPKNQAVGKLTEGCPNKCFWCVVPKKEGRIRPYMDIEEIAIEGRTHVVLRTIISLQRATMQKSSFRRLSTSVCISTSIRRWTRGWLLLNMPSCWAR